MAKNQTIRITAQCQFKKDGLRCQRQTTMTHPYCAIHTREVYGVEVKPSQIKAAGLGLWATRNFPKGHMLFTYEGERLSQAEYDLRYEDDTLGVYGIGLTKKTVIDARRTDAGVARYICTFQGSGKKPNVEYQSDNKVIEMITTRAIKAGEELLSDYGEEMCIALGLLKAPAAKKSTKSAAKKQSSSSKKNSGSKKTAAKKNAGEKSTTKKTAQPKSAAKNAKSATKKSSSAAKKNSSASKTSKSKSSKSAAKKR